MSTPRFFVEGECAPGSEISLEREDARHVRLVLRLRPGGPIVVVRNGTAWDAKLTDMSDARTKARVVDARDERSGELPAAITVLQALTKGAKFDEVVEKVVELGARRIVPVRCERSYADAGSHKLQRWRRIARAAASQSRRRFLPIVEEPLDWNAAIHSQPVLIAYEAAPPNTLEAALTRLRDAEPFAIAVGPEGGLAPAEVDAARAAGAALVSLGPTIVRTETAAPALLAAIAACRGWW